MRISSDFTTTVRYNHLHYCWSCTDLLGEGQCLTQRCNQIWRGQRGVLGHRCPVYGERAMAGPINSWYGKKDFSLRESFGLSLSCLLWSVDTDTLQVLPPRFIFKLGILTSASPSMSTFPGLVNRPWDTYTSSLGAATQTKPRKELSISVHFKESGDSDLERKVFSSFAKLISLSYMRGFDFHCIPLLFLGLLALMASFSFLPLPRFCFNQFIFSISSHMVYYLDRFWSPFFGDYQQLM